MAADFPHQYEVSLRLDDASRAEGTVSTPDGPSVPVGPPPQFDGRPGHRSPEDLLLAAVATCQMTTALALLRRRGLPLRDYRSVATGTLEKTPEGLRFTAIRLRIAVVTEPGREAAVERVVNAAESFCIVTAALRPPIELELSVSAGE